MAQLLAEKSRPRTGARWATVAVIVFLTLFAAFRGLDSEFGELVGYALRGFDRAAASLAGEFFPTAAYFWAPLLTVMFFERLVPANRSQRTLSAGLFGDLIWFLSAPVFAIFLVSRLREYLGTIHTFQLGGMSAEPLLGLPIWAQFLIVVLASDFLSWFSHFLRHKIPVLWYFHSIHHSQRELNVFTDHRVHPIEQLFSVLIRFWPMTLLELRHGVALGIVWSLFLTWHPMIYHANIRSNYGWLRYVFVTPQSHRIHHSRLPQHRDRNFGTIFSIWDYAFGTQYRNYDEYPPAGVSDSKSPLPDSSKPIELVSAYARQLVYPFKLIVKKGL
jgi:sterol desaturase/sphingolipid hydroxylase (fatty acid hydroxylase superfamily)